jgi:hypothetical protein
MSGCRDLSPFFPGIDLPRERAGKRHHFGLPASDRPNRTPLLVRLRQRPDERVMGSGLLEAELDRTGNF